MPRRNDQFLSTFKIFARAQIGNKFNFFISFKNFDIIMISWATDKHWFPKKNVQKLEDAWPQIAKKIVLHLINSLKTKGNKRPRNKDWN